MLTRWFRLIGLLLRVSIQLASMRGRALLLALLAHLAYRPCPSGPEAAVEPASARC